MAGSSMLRTLPRGSTRVRQRRATPRQRERFAGEVDRAGDYEIDRVVASNYVGTAPGALLDRAAALEQYRQWKLTDFAMGDLKTELNGPTFIVTYSITLSGTAAGQALPSPQHMMTVWHQHKSGWMVIAHSASQP